MKSFFAIDLFAGCGGLSEGFINAGFDVIAQIEMNDAACDTLKSRHLFYELKKIERLDLYDAYVKGSISSEHIFNEVENIKEPVSQRVIQVELKEDTIKTTIERIEANKKFYKASKIHVFLGGPPCQPYSIINRARIQKNGDERGRNYLYQHYLDLMRHFKPDIFIYENVPGLFTVKDGGQRIFEKLLDDFSQLNPAYKIIPPLHLVSKDPHSYILNSVNFGVPQNRKRLILIGYREKLEQKNRKIKEIFEILNQTRSDPEEGNLTVRDAISDLPSLKPDKGNNGYFGPYGKNKRLRSYQEKMRKLSPGVVNHFARSHMASDLDRYRFFIEHYKNTKKAATLYELLEQRPDLVPEHKHLDKFVDRFKVQWWTKPSSTITAHISKDGHYFIHPDIHQCRSFTVREAARCQSFPDNYKFEGPRTEQFKQVGNAVPPLLAERIAVTIRDVLEKI